MAEAEAEQFATGWRVVAGQQGDMDIVVEATGAKLKNDQVQAVLTVRVGDAVALKTICNLTYEKSRTKILKALQEKNIVIDDAVLLVLEQACRTAPRADQVPPRADEGTCPYRATPGGLIWSKQTRDGSVDVVLTNFTAMIVGDILEDDGAESRRFYEIEAYLGGQTFRFTVPSGQFATMRWATEHLGARAIVEPGFGAVDHARVAIQRLSQNIEERVEFAHTGWREIDGRWLYLHADGAIGADGVVPGVRVRLLGNLARYRLPAPPVGAELVTAVQTSSSLLELAPYAVTAPALAATYLAPLCELLGTERPDMTLWLHGATGRLKTELVALMQGHFGDFDRLTLPATFTATANALERLLFTVKDAMLAVDDYHPAGDAYEAQRMAQVASRMLRGVGNGSGRQRMQADTRARPDLPPRGLPVATAERLVTGHSTAARMFPVPVDAGAIDRDRLTRAQRERNRLPAAMAAYVRWLASRFARLRDELPDRFRALRAQVQLVGGHSREPGQIAHLYVSLETWLTFAVEVGAVDAEAAKRILTESWNALLDLAAEHARELADETPSERFLNLLRDGFASRRIYLTARDGTMPADALDWGWGWFEWTDSSGESQRELRPAPQATLVGAIDADWLLLVPSAAYQFVVRAARDAGTVFPVEQKTLLKRLDEDRLIATQVDGGSRRRTVKEQFGNTERRVLKLCRAAMVVTGTGTTGTAGTPGGGTQSPDRTGSTGSSNPSHSDGTSPTGEWEEYRVPK